MILLLILSFKLLTISANPSNQKFAVIFNNQAFLKQIRPKTIKELYEVSKLWIPFNLKNAEYNIKKLESQKLSTKMKVKVLILKSFILLKKNLIVLSIAKLKEAKKTFKQKKIKDKELEEFINMQMARLYAVNNDLVHALKKYQSINKNSKYYKNSLIETVWLLSKSSGDYKNTIEHLNVLVIWHDTNSTKIKGPNDREVLDFILEKAKIYLKVLDLENSANTYKEFLERYKKIQAKYKELPNAKFTGNTLTLNKCKSKLRNAPLILFSKRCIKDDFLNIWLTSHEKKALIREIKTFDFLNTHNLINPYIKQKYSSLLVNYINANIQTANARLTSKKLEAKTGILQISIALKDINKSKNKKGLEHNYRKLNRLETLYKKLLTD